MLLLVILVFFHVSPYILHFNDKFYIFIYDMLRGVMNTIHWPTEVWHRRRIVWHSLSWGL